MSRCGLYDSIGSLVTLEIVGSKLEYPQIFL